MMANETLIQRKPLPAGVAAEKLSESNVPEEKKTAHTNKAEKQKHPGGDIKHGGSKQILRLVLMVIYSLAACVS